jgi:hypothetical protein
MHQQVGFGSFGESEAVVLHLFMFDSQVRRENIPSVRHFSGQNVFIKLEPTEGDHHRGLAHEFRVYEKLRGGPGIPRVHWFGTEAGLDAMAIDRLGQSLKDLFVCCKFRFSYKTVLLLACQLASGLHSLSQS